MSSGASRATQVLEILRRATSQQEATPSPQRPASARWSTTPGATSPSSRRQRGRPGSDPRPRPRLGRRGGIDVSVKALKRVIEHLPDGARALVVRRSPTNEQRCSVLTGTVWPRWAEAKASPSLTRASRSPPLPRPSVTPRRRGRRQRTTAGSSVAARFRRQLFDARVADLARPALNDGGDARPAAPRDRAVWSHPVRTPPRQGLQVRPHPAVLPRTPPRRALTLAHQRRGC